MGLRAIHGVARGAGQGDQALEGSLHTALVGIHRRFIARCYCRGCPAVALQSRVLHYGRRVYLADRQALSSSLHAGLARGCVDLESYPESLPALSKYLCHVSNATIEIAETLRDNRDEILGLDLQGLHFVLVL
jgi:hypothetical protein